ncbi:hypothetical protein EVAR_13382_1 [Eumeta japonica]|uniref:Uncharacterized protein n=1 Tax=Eumeta variegata TaxID=151549 RepID=A0A4C1TRZ8_EUMVA|nr:hypothetical protein EVAR_13382_1 [Eumeta japonica]
MNNYGQKEREQKPILNARHIEKYTREGEALGSPRSLWCASKPRVDVEAIAPSTRIASGHPSRRCTGGVVDLISRPHSFKSPAVM